MPDTCSKFALAILLSLVLILAVWAAARPAAAAEVSGATQYCLDCHSMATPAIVADWKNSRHSRTSVAEALQKDKAARRVSVEKAPEGLGEQAVGCAECHSRNPDGRADSFDHEGSPVHTVVTPADCSSCHPAEVEQFGKNKMAWAHKNLTANPLFMELVASINNPHAYQDGKLVRGERDEVTDQDSCLACHGTKIEVDGTYSASTDFGDMEFPKLTGWPNNGVGRVNPDGSRGSCAACHTRHQFSIKTARQPYTCAQCHKGPDVPAYKIYQVSKHGNVFFSHKDEWDLEAVPWTAGADFSAPTCATCHISNVVDQTGAVLAERTHRMNDRLAWRLFGLIYSHRQPKKADTSVISNQDGLPLPTDFSGAEADQYLISPEEVDKRVEVMQGVCLGCHSRQWVEGHWVRLEHSLKTADEDAAAATAIVSRAWEYGAAAGPAQKGSPFDEALERMWVGQWLFYANSVRMASAMLGADYGVFEGGRWNASARLYRMNELLELRLKASRAD